MARAADRRSVGRGSRSRVTLSSDAPGESVLFVGERGGDVDGKFGGNAPVHWLIQCADWPPSLVVLVAVQLRAVVEPPAEVVESLVVVARLFPRDAEVQVEAVDRRVQVAVDLQQHFLCIIVRLSDTTHANSASYPMRIEI